jgi:uncharacterized protein (DUF2062 family)
MFPMLPKAEVRSNEPRPRILRTRAYADFRCGLAAGSFAGYLPWFGISISF